eukprot:CAMPEP_0205918796 /NCGR_PEP_ID=MMETSP1325-20131115/10024_1 /ASSEMBLY_ACC=CAM_ASM_000708 /TAXON_ID=236786 /ORGANISM="Florenciella sp., Strain RCC1007" /LENGTH=82 /DNA_ID=CAMNT_0053286353 /DNA_START=6 /DNA_END=254 /DNA_ORIENTATION=+
MEEMCAYGALLAELSSKCRKHGHETHENLQLTIDVSLNALKKEGPKPMRLVPGLVVARLPWKEIRALQAELRDSLTLAQQGR